MENKRLWLGMLAVVLVFGMTVVGCDIDGNDSALNGTWVCAGYAETKLHNGNYKCTVYSSGTVEEEGSYVLNNNIISFTQNYPQNNYTYTATYFPEEKKYVIDGIGYTMAYIRK